jgi:hypothetical protein
MIGQAERLRALREEPQDRFCVFADCQPGSRVHIQHDAHGQPRPSTEPVTAQRRASNTGVIMVAGQKIALGRIHAGQVVTVHVAAETITIDLDDQDSRTVRRTTTQPVRSIKAAQSRKAAHVS